jgi:sigma-B regulation protein RsbU (phosphoserine phosphatase)
MLDNVYNTSDPKKLLELKRLEADALLDVLRTINNQELKIEQLCLIARNVLRAQIGVKKMVFYYEAGGEWQEGINLGFRETDFPLQKEILNISKTQAVTPESLPLLHAFGAEYVVPIRNREDPRAYFAIADFADTEIELQNDLIFIETIGSILFVAIQNRFLFRAKMRQEFLRKELEVAEIIQNQLLISDFERFHEIDVHGLNVAHHGVGGDFYDIIRKGPGSTFVCIGDVSGKGIGAALLMSNLQANLRALCAHYDDLPSIISELNRTLFQITRGEKFVTLFLALIDEHSRTLHFVNAGHNYPLLLQEEKYNFLKSGCMILGIMEDIVILEEQTNFVKDEVLFMYTDGLVEQTNRNGDMFGTQRLVFDLQQKQTHSAKEIIFYMRDLWAKHAEQAEIGDDVTMLCVKFL